MKIMDAVRNKVRSFLQIEPPTAKTISIRETLDYQGNAIKNRIWYRGDRNELSQLYQNIAEQDDRFMFWAARPTPGMEIRKIHTGLPAVIVDTLAGIVVTNMNDFQFANDSYAQLWDEISEENGLKDMLSRAIAETLYIGDGAFKISLDPGASKYPILEYFPGDRVDYTMRRGRITETIFRSPMKTDAGKVCELREIYGLGYIRYELLLDDKKVELSQVAALADLKDVEFGNKDDPYMLAVPVRFFQSDRWPGRGQSVFDKKIESFDAFDEAWSQWMDALRSGRTKTYIPENLVPRDPETGELKRPNSFDNRFITTGADMSQNAQNKVQTEQASIAHDSYIATYSTALDQCLQGLISPASLGVDVKKLDNAEAQREKEKVTLYTRSKIVEPMQVYLRKLVDASIRAYYERQGTTPPEPVEVDVTFGDYANPSFESQVETVGKAMTQGIMSVESAVDELYGDTRDDDWKKEEVSRIKAQQGMLERQEPSVRQDSPFFGGGFV